MYVISYTTQSVMVMHAKVYSFPEDDCCVYTRLLNSTVEYVFTAYGSRTPPLHLHCPGAMFTDNGTLQHIRTYVLSREMIRC